MAGPLSITASALAVASLAVSSCKSLRDTTTCIRNAPQALKDTRNQLDTLEHLIDTLIGSLNSIGGISLTQNQQNCFADFRLVLDNCRASCNDFAQKVNKITSASKPDRISTLDRWKLYLDENDIAVFQTIVERDKQTLDIALGTTTLQTLHSNADALQVLDTRVGDAIRDFTGQVEGLQLAIHSLASSSTTQPDNLKPVMQVLQSQDVMLRQCLKVCQTTLKETSKETGMMIKHAVAMDKASIFIGSMGGELVSQAQTPTIMLDLLEAKNQGKAVAGTMSADVAKAFWTS